jgi:hypothetical protein
MRTVYALAMLAIATVPAWADVLYSNGPINGTIGALFIGNVEIPNVGSFSYATSDSFVLSSASTVTGVDFGAWTAGGDSITSVQWSIGTTPGGSSLGSGVANTIDTFFAASFSGSTVDSDSFSTGNISLGAGTYYLTLQNANTAQGRPPAWDINNGPSSAFYGTGASLANVAGRFGPGSDSEAFDIQGTTTAVTPEPGSYAALVLALGGVMLVWSRRAKERG